MPRAAAWRSWHSPHAVAAWAPCGKRVGSIGGGGSVARVAVLRYAAEPGFAITAWRPGAPASRRIVDVALTEAAPHVVRVDVDRALAADPS